MKITQNEDGTFWATEARDAFLLSSLDGCDLESAIKVLTEGFQSVRAGASNARLAHTERYDDEWDLVIHFERPATEEEIATWKFQQKHMEEHRQEGRRRLFETLKAEFEGEGA